jgi:signal transduction histidine kinase
MDRDVTDRVMAEQELRKHREHLEELIEERTAELIVAKEQAEAADRVKSVFLATMSHELRTPLNSIIGFTELLEQERTGPLNKEQKQQLGVVRESGSHLLNLINDILDISKIEAGQLKVSRESFDLRALIERATRATKPLSKEKSIELEVEIADDVNSISSDRRRVEQILLNLLSNAIKFTDEGKIHVSCSLQGREVSVSVRDTGIGIRSQDVERLFKPFQQIQTGRHFEGTGLGLSICKKLLDLLGGRIEVHSEWGKGSTFSFALPVEEPKE